MEEKKLVQKKHAIYSQTYSILRLIEPIIYNENNLTVPSIYRETGQFLLPVNTKDVYIRLNRTHFGRSKKIATTQYARINIRTQIINPKFEAFEKWRNWLDEKAISLAGVDDQHERLQKEILMGRRRPMILNANHKFELTNANKVKSFFGSTEVICAISKKPITGPLYRCTYCKMVIRSDLANKSNMVACSSNQGESTENQGQPHKNLVKKYVWSSVICAHSGVKLRLMNVLVCLDCGKAFHPQYQHMLIRNCGDDDVLYEALKGQEEPVYGDLNQSAGSGQGEDENAYEAPQSSTMVGPTGTAYEMPFDSKPISGKQPQQTNNRVRSSAVTEKYEDDLSDLKISEASGSAHSGSHNLKTKSNKFLTLQRSETQHRKQFRRKELTKLELSDFTLLNKLGEGTYGVVLGARYNPNPKLHVALKVVKKQAILDHGLPTDMFNEEFALKMCTDGFNKDICLNVCTFIGSWQDHNRLYFAMEHLPNNTLYYHCAENPESCGPQSANFCKYYGTEVARGLTFLHERHVIHRDLKLENVALDVDGHCRLIDFGMIKRNADKGYATSFVGTPNYIAPEMISYQKYNLEVDWWALGVLIYEMHRNKNLFNGRDEDEMYDQIIRDKKLRFATERNMDMSVANVLTGLLNRDASRRLSYRRHQSPSQQPLSFHQFFVDGERLLASEEPPIASKYVVDDETNDEASNIYLNRTGTIATRAKRKGNRLLPDCPDKIPERQNNLFKEFGVIMDSKKY